MSPELLLKYGIDTDGERLIEGECKPESVNVMLVRDTDAHGNDVVCWVDCPHCGGGEHRTNTHAGEDGRELVWEDDYAICTTCGLVLPWRTDGELAYLNDPADVHPEDSTLFHVWAVSEALFNEKEWEDRDDLHFIFYWRLGT